MTITPPCPAPDTCILYLIRHGATDNNLAHPPKLQGRLCNPPLSPTGRAQAAACGRFLAEGQIQAIFSSPLLRAMETAQLIAAQLQIGNHGVATLARAWAGKSGTHGLATEATTHESAAAPAHEQSVTAIEALTECDIGRWEGRDWSDIERNDAEAHRLFLEDASLHPYAGGENLTQVAQRVVPALESLAAGHLGRSIAVVAHNVVNRCCLSHSLGLPLRFARQLPQHNCGLNILRYRHGKATLLTLNSVLHLADW